MDLLTKVRKDFKHIEFEKSDNFSWSPDKKTVFYSFDQINGEWSLLHELGHVLCGHNICTSDISLLIMEVQAWQKAQHIAEDYGLRIKPEHIEKCLDSYRDWLYKRSACPKCYQAGLEKTTGRYTCINCSNSWTVTSERFCRVYRRTENKIPQDS